MYGVCFLPRGNFSLGFLHRKQAEGQRKRSRACVLRFYAAHWRVFKCELKVSCVFPNCFLVFFFFSTRTFAQLFFYSCWIVRGCPQQPPECWPWATAAIRALSLRKSCLYSWGCHPPPSGEWSHLCPQAGGAEVWNAGHADPRSLLVRGETARQWRQLQSTTHMQADHGLLHHCSHQQVN